MKRTLLFIFAFCLFTFVFASSDCIPDKPSPPRLVNNLSKEFPDFLSEWEEEQLEQKLEDFSKETSNQIVVVIIDDLCGTDANFFSTELGHKWGVGQGKFDNGVVVMIKPTGGAGQRDAYIAVGYGLEGAIPDITAKQIVANELIPQFKNGNFYDGLNDATDVIISLAKKEYNYQDYPGKKQNWFPFLIGVSILILIFYFVFRNSKGYTMSSGGRTYYGGGWSSWGGGGWGGGSSGGGGFGGFGGGGFGGGGAGGKW